MSGSGVPADGRSTTAAGSSRGSVDLAAVYRVVLAYAAHPDERVRVLAGGTLAAAAWTYGATPTAPSTGWHVPEPSMDDLAREYLATLERRAEAPDRLAFACDTGIADWLGAFVDPDRPDPPWWELVPDPASSPG